VARTRRTQPVPQRAQDRPLPGFARSSKTSTPKRATSVVRVTGPQGVVLSERRGRCPPRHLAALTRAWRSDPSCSPSRSWAEAFTACESPATPLWLATCDALWTTRSTSARDCLHGSPWLPQR
jgi:hypothetical protein